jgi:signal transduction histidine kinase
VLENAIFRIVQESLTNVRRHSESENVQVDLIKKSDVIQIEIEDWGVGFDPENTSGDCFGLVGIQERVRMLGGNAIIDSEPGKGTRVVVKLPLP